MQQGFVDVAGLAELPPGSQLGVTLGQTRILLCHDAASQRIHAVEDRCSHAMQALAGGVQRNGTLQCPKHGACFELATGQPTNAVTHRPIKVHAVQLVDGRIQVCTSSRTPVSA